MRHLDQYDETIPRRYPHAVQLSPHTHMVDVETWLSRNVLPGNVHYDGFRAPWWWCFRRHEDAFAFKIRWG
jgi:hypothetical protein